MCTWKEWLEQHGFKNLLPLPDNVLAREWKPTDEDKNAAWDLYTELRTRITTQPLHYLAGDMATALKSVYDLFDMTRGLLHKYQRKCSHFATLGVYLLNGVVRPFTAKWHEIQVKGGLGNEDVCHDFRLELQELRDKLIPFQQLLGRLAEGDDFQKGSEGGVLEQRPPYDMGPPIVSTGLLGISDANIWAQEAAGDSVSAAAVLGASPANADDLVGMALSGGGIRSATFVRLVSSSDSPARDSWRTSITSPRFREVGIWAPS